YEALRKADVLVLATPVYVPLPGKMQDFLNRMVPLLEPALEFRNGRTRAKMRSNVNLSKFVLVSTGGWWELGNFDSVVHIVEELAETSSVEFAGAILRPHAGRMKEKPDKAEEIFDAARAAGHQFATNGSISQETLDSISQPLISEKEYWAKR
ncbi:MAG: iron-sulfur flavoprotein, partial [Candidatus Thorarchaeota archaeon]